MLLRVDWCTDQSDILQSYILEIDAVTNNKKCNKMSPLNMCRSGHELSEPVAFRLDKIHSDRTFEGGYSGPRGCLAVSDKHKTTYDFN